MFLKTIVVDSPVCMDSFLCDILGDWIKYSPPLSQTSAVVNNGSSNPFSILYLPYLNEIIIVNLLLSVYWINFKILAEVSFIHLILSFFENDIRDTTQKNRNLNEATEWCTYMTSIKFTYYTLILWAVSIKKHPVYTSKYLKLHNFFWEIWADFLKIPSEKKFIPPFWENAFSMSICKFLQMDISTCLIS